MDMSQMGMGMGFGGMGQGIPAGSLNPPPLVFKTLEVLLVKLPQQQAVMTRPYTLIPDLQAINSLTDTVIQHNAVNLNKSIMASHLTDMIRPSATAFGTFANESWFGEQRLLFYVRIECLDRKNNPTWTHLTGYTNGNGMGNTYGSVTVAPDMIFTIDSVIETAPKVGMVNGNRVVTEQVVRRFSLLATKGSLDTFTLRPDDVISNIGIMTTAENYDPNVNVDSYNVMTSMNEYSPLLFTNKSSNSIMSDYFIGVANEGMRTVRNNLVGNYGSITEDTTTVSEIRREPNFGDNNFIRYLSKMMGYSVPKQFFSWEGLMKICPNSYDVLVYNSHDVGGGSYINGDAVPTIGESWAGQDPTTIIATSLMSQMIAEANEMCIQDVVLELDTTDLTQPLGPGMLVIKDGNTRLRFDNTNMISWFEEFRTKVWMDIILPETNMGNIMIKGKFYINLLGITSMWIEYNGFPGKWVTLASALQGIFNPVMTTDVLTRNYIAGHFNNVINNIVDNTRVIQPGTTPYQTPYF